MTKTRMCRVCRCTERNACYDPKTGEGCRWAGKDICNVCDDQARAIKLVCSARSTLRDLVARGCVTRGTAKPSPGGHGLTHSQLLARRGVIERDYDGDRARMVYWATPLGREVARRAA